MKHEAGTGDARQVEIGQPTAAEEKHLRRAGLLQALSDLLWIGQAAILAATLGAVVSAAAGGDLELAVSSLSIWQAVAILAFAAVRIWLQNLSQYMARCTAREIQSRARSELLAVAVRYSPAAPFPSSGTFAAHLTEQVDLLGPYFRNYVPQLARLKIVPVGIVLATLCFSWAAALILLICGPLIPVFMALIGTKAKTASISQQEELTRLSGVLLDRIKGLETLVVFGAVEQTKSEIRSAGEDFRVGTMRVLRIAFLSSTVLELFSALGIAFCAVYVGFSLLGDLQFGTWTGQLNYSAGLFVLLLAPEFFAPLRSFAAAYHDRAAGMAAQQKLSGVLSQTRSSPARPVQLDQKVSDFALTNEGVDVRFENASLCLSDTHVFKDLSFSVHPSETLILTGPSGSGKTVLLDCLLGFHDLQRGDIKIAGNSLAKVKAQLRKSVIWLGQEPRLFHGSLRANLLLGTQSPDDTSEDDLWNALKIAGVDKLVERLPRGLSTNLGEDGFGLSVGEIRRIALARAAIRTGAGLLLADEPTAGLDQETAADVIEGLARLCQGRTAVIATHDPAVLQIPGKQVEIASLFRNELAEMLS